MREKTWISRAGNLNKKESGKRGFTIIELVIVLSITGIVLFFSIPAFKEIHIFSDPTKALGQTVQLIDLLKKKAMADNRDYFMHLEIAEGMVWVSDDSMDEEAMKLAREKGILFSGETILLGVEFPKAISSAPDEVGIRFNRNGYSDMALIQVREGENHFTLRIEPFLLKAELQNGRISFDQCR